MTQEEFKSLEEKYGLTIELLRHEAHELHQSVNQIYGDNLPYGFHLDMVVEMISKYGHLVCACENDLLPLFFGGFFHDSIEDARLSYNDVMKRAKNILTDDQALMATEIVYALTNDKGRTRSERAGEKYYQGIRETPYAPFVKLCDRMANVSYSCSDDNSEGNRMKQVYKNEMHHFLASINPHSTDMRFFVPGEMIEALAEILISDLEREEISREWKQI